MTISYRSMRRLGPTVLAAPILLASLGYALAGADDGGARSFWNVPAPGSAGGMPETTTPGTDNPAAAAQPNASISRTGVAQDQSLRSKVAVTRMGREHYVARSHALHVYAARHDARPTLAAEHGSAEHKSVLHALHRGSETNSNQS